MPVFNTDRENFTKPVKKISYVTTQRLLRFLHLYRNFSLLLLLLLLQRGHIYSSSRITNIFIKYIIIHYGQQ
jgi:hypothetical protein